MSSRLPDALALAEETLAKLEMGEGRLSSLVPRCLRVARMMGNADVEQWLRCELRGYGPRVAGDDNWAVYAGWSGRQASPNAQGQQLYYTAPIEQIETELELALGEHRAALAAAPEPVADAAEASPSGQLAEERARALLQATRGVNPDQIRARTRIVATLRGSLHDWLSWAVVELRYGAVVDAAFQKTAQRVDDFLTHRAPAVGRALAAACAGSPREAKEWTQSLTSCRQALEALADAVCAPAKEGASEGEYKGRLLQFVSERSPSAAERDLLREELALVAKRVDALHALADEETHEDAQLHELERTVVRTYLLAGELLALLPEAQPLPTPAAPVEEPPAAREASPSRVEEEPPAAAPSEDEPGPFDQAGPFDRGGPFDQASSV